MRSLHEKTSVEASPAAAAAGGESNKAEKAEENRQDILEANSKEASSMPSENIVDELCDDEEEASPGAQQFECVTYDLFFVLTCFLICPHCKVRKSLSVSNVIRRLILELSKI